MINIDTIRSFIIIMNPFMPHLAQELWELIGETNELTYQGWPDYDKDLVISDEIVIPIQINGKRRSEILISANESESEVLTGISVTDFSSAEKAADVLLYKGIKIVIVTMGEKGSLLKTNNLTKIIPGLNVDAVDATAAGDAFCGTLAVSVARGDSWESAVNFANAAGALAVTKLGAAPSIPTREQVIELIERNRN